MQPPFGQDQYVTGWSNLLSIGDEFSFLLAFPSSLFDNMILIQCPMDVLWRGSELTCLIVAFCKHVDSTFAKPNHSGTLRLYEDGISCLGMWIRNGP